MRTSLTNSDSKRKRNTLKQLQKSKDSRKGAGGQEEVLEQHWGGLHSEGLGLNILKKYQSYYMEYILKYLKGMNKEK